MSIRDGRRSDHMQLMLLDRKSFDTPVPGMFWYDFLDMDVVHVSVEAGKVHGFIVTRHTRSGIRIVRLAVSPDFRRLGVGSRLIQNVLDNTASTNFYTLVPESRALDGVGRFLNTNNFQATKYDTRNRIRFVYRDPIADPGTSEGVRSVSDSVRASALAR